MFIFLRDTEYSRGGGVVSNISTQILLFVKLKKVASMTTYLSPSESILYELLKVSIFTGFFLFVCLF
jgi:hypothetical protein